VVAPPKCRPLGHHLINKKRIGPFRKHFSCFDHVWPAPEPRGELMDAERWPLGSHWPPQGLGDLDHQPGPIGPMIPRLLLDAHAVFEPP
jgi:hypothetical protein